MMNYERPMLVKTEQMSEGVYLASGAGVGAGCYTSSAYIHQTAELGRHDYRIQVDAQHNADHTKDAQTLTISFNLPVVWKSGWTLLSGSGTQTLTIAMGYHQNPTDSIGFGDLIVEADEGLTITGVSVTD